MKTIIIYSLMILMTISCRKSFEQDAVKSAVKIVNGSEIIENDPTIKTTVAIFPSSMAAGPHCTGTLIGKNHVVTAAHCLKSKPYKIGFGIKGKDSSFKVVNYKVHPSYSSWRQTGDIGVVTFEGTINPSEHVPVAIAEATAGLEVIITGYGVTGEPKRDSGTLRTVETTVGQIKESTKEFVSSRDGKGACFGDSGGPVYIEENGGYKVIGATSRGASCEAGDGIYTDVGKYKDWLKEAFSELGTPLEEVEAPGGNLDNSDDEMISPSLDLNVAFEDAAKGSYLWVSSDKNTAKVVLCADADFCEGSADQIELVKVGKNNSRRLFFRSPSSLGIKARIKIKIISYASSGEVLKTRDLNVKAR